MSKPPRDRLFGRVRHGNIELYQVGINADGSLWNPNGYPDDMVRAAIAAADSRRHERRSKAAKQAAETRAVRQQDRVGYIAKRVAAAQKTGPRSHCYVCGRHLTDPESITRGIGSECWQDVLAQISEITRAAHGGAR
jgi:protein-arginine kinase activator protein McsA